MIYKHFYIKSIVRLILIFINMFLLILLFNYTIEKVFFLRIITLSLLILQIVFLFKFFRKSYDGIERTLKLLQSGIYTDKSSHIKGVKSLEDLNLEISKTIQSFQDISNKYQSQHEYLALLIDTIDTGILSVNETNKIELSNRSAFRILGVKKIKYLDDIAEAHQILFDTIKSTSTSRQFLIDLKSNNISIPISVNIELLEVLGKKHKLITLTNISEGILKTETETWNKLIKILNHEIFNSVTPLSSLSNTLRLIVNDKNGEPKHSDSISDDNIADLAEGLDILNERSKKLLRFISGFKQLSKIPPPKIEPVNVLKLLNKISSLYNNDLDNENITLKIEADENLIINADETQIEQCLINLISNSIFALDTISDKQIELKASCHNNITKIELKDNGIGVQEEYLDKIFTPFYTTRKEGSGIGLSLSKYIVQLNNGQIFVESKPNEGCCFTLQFNS